MKKQLQIFSFILSVTYSYSQNGSGNFGYRFLDLPMPARAAALGGSSMSIYGDDINLYFSNPALLNKYMGNQLAVNYCNYVSDLNYGNVAYARQINDKIGTIGGGIQFFNYGKFDKRDEYDISQGTFRAADYSFNLSMAKQLKDTCFSVGGTLKTIYSHYDIYRSFANAIDFGITYHHKSSLTLSVLAKNVGHVWRSYSTSAKNEGLPQDVQMGMSYKVKKAPFRIIFVYDQLTKWNLTYSSPLDETNQIDPFTNKPVKTKTKFQTNSDKFARHWIFATEIVLTKNFNLRVGYNYRLHKEMMLPDKRGANGLSFGFGVKIYKFHLSYSFAKYNVAGNSSVFSITTNLNSFMR